MYNSLQHALSLFSLLCLRQTLPGNGFNGERSLTLDFRTIPAPQLTASNSNGSQGLNRSSPLTHSLTHSPTNSLQFTQSNCTALTNWTELGRSSHTASERTYREHRLQHLFYCYVTSPRTWCVPLLRVYGPLPSNGSTCYIIIISSTAISAWLLELYFITVVFYGILLLFYFTTNKSINKCVLRRAPLS
jgi:hypothetical protein